VYVYVFNDWINKQKEIKVEIFHFNFRIVAIGVRVVLNFSIVQKYFSYQC